MSVAACQAPTQPTTPTPPVTTSSRVDVLNTANAAFARGDLASASALYERVINAPPTGESPGATSAITQFAYFRDVVSLLAAGRQEDAHAQLLALERADANAPLARVANQVYDQYGMIGALRGACTQIQPQISAQAGPTLATLQALGVAVDPQTLCSPG